MPDLADLFPGFASKWIDTTAGRIFARTGGEGPPLLLLHGYPQTNVMWHRVAPALARHFSLIMPDLPGYGWSAAPASDAAHAPYTKRAMANAMIEVMEALGHVHFRLAGHDRGGRVAYRLALDHPGRLARLATLDIVPTWAMWRRMDARLANRAWHWMFLALPAPFPETMIGKDPLFFFDARAAAGTKIKSLSAFDPRALAHYHAFSATPSASTPPARTTAPVAPPISPTTMSRAPRPRKSPVRCWRSGAVPAASRPRPTIRSRPGANGPSTCKVFPSTAGITSPKRRHRRQPKR
jgi:haloacetate dehalogenase